MKANTAGRSVTKPKRDQGFALITAIFVLLLLSAVGATLATNSIVQEDIAGQALRQAQTELALKAATEWYLSVVSGGACNGAPAMPANPPQPARPAQPSVQDAIVRFDLYGINTLNNVDGVLVDVTCADATFQDGANAVQFMPTTLQATYGRTVLNAVNRRVEVSRVVRLEAL